MSDEGSRSKSEAGLYALTIALCVLLLFPVFRLEKADLRVPFFPGGDATFYQGIVIRPLIQQLWYITNPRLGAPGGLALNDFPTGTDSLLYLMMKMIGMVVRDSAATLNLFFLLTFPLAAASMLYAARKLMLRRTTAVVVSLLFAFAPYHFMRGEGHIALSSYFMLPLGLVIALKLGDVFRPMAATGAYGSLRAVLTTLRASFRDRAFRRLFVLLCVVSAALALSGVYYAFFYIVMLFAVAARRAVDERRWSQLVMPLTLSAVVLATVVLSNVPMFVYRAQNGPNLVAAGHPVAEAEIYALRPVQLFVPITGHRIPAFSAAERAYKGFLGSLNPAFDNESRFASLGVVAAFGFVLLLLWALLGMRAPPEAPEAMQHVGDLASINLAMLLLGTVGGAGYLVAQFLTPMFRGYNRVSIVIAMVALLAVGAWLEDSLPRIRRLPKWFFGVVMVAILVLGLLDQTALFWYVPEYSANKAANQIEREFAAAAERALPDRAMVFQLPFVTFPGADRAYPAGFGGYTHLIPYIYSKDLRWSFAAMRSRPTSDWQRAVASMQPAEMVAALREAGFAAVYVDTLGFDDKGSAISAGLNSVLGPPIVNSPDGRMLLWKLTESQGSGQTQSTDASTTTSSPTPVPLGDPASGSSSKDVVNPSFEQWSNGAFVGWSSSASTPDESVSQRPEWKKSGSYGVRLMDPGTDARQVTSIWQTVPVDSGKTYEASVWAISDRKSSAVQFGMQFLDGTGKVSSEEWTSGDSWGVGTKPQMERMTVKGTVPKGATKANIVCRIVSGPTTTGAQALSSATFDDVTLTAGN